MKQSTVAVAGQQEKHPRLLNAQKKKKFDKKYQVKNDCVHFALLMSHQAPTKRLEDVFHWRRPHFTPSAEI